MVIVFYVSEIITKSGYFFWISLKNSESQKTKNLLGDLKIGVFDLKIDTSKKNEEIVKLIEMNEHATKFLNMYMELDQKFVSEFTSQEIDKRELKNHKKKKSKKKSIKNNKKIESERLETNQVLINILESNTVVKTDTNQKMDLNILSAANNPTDPNLESNSDPESDSESKKSSGRYSNNFIFNLEAFLFNNSQNIFDPYNNPDTLNTSQKPKIAHKLLDLKPTETFKFLSLKKIKINEKEELELQFFYKTNPETNTIQIIFNEVSEMSKIQNKKSEKWIKALFLGKICHEFKNPLISIEQLMKKLLESIFQKNYNELEKIAKKLSLISHYMLFLIKDFDDKSQNESFENLTINKEFVNLAEVTTLVQEIFETRVSLSSKNLLIETIIERNVPRMIYTDPTRLKQILINLVSNSFKFTLMGSITTKVSKDGEDFIKFAAVDSGPGMSQQKLSKLTTPYTKFQTKGNEFGAGLGLTICKDMINKLGSEFKILSKEGEGTEISFLIYYKKVNYDDDVKRDSLTLPMDNDNNKICSPFKTIRSSYKKNSPSKSIGSSVKTIKVEYLIPTTPPKYMLDLYDKYHPNSRKISANMPDLYEEENEEEDNISEHFSENKLTISNNTNKVDSVNKFTKFVPEKIIYLNLPSIFRIKYYSSITSNSQEYNKKKHFNIILCEDETLIRQSQINNIIKVLDEKKYSYTIAECVDGIEGLYELFIGMLRNIKYDYLFTDQNMVFMNGDEVCKNINRMIMSGVLYKIKVVIATSYSKDYDSFKNIKGVDEILCKPISKNVFEKYFFKEGDLN